MVCSEIQKCHVNSFALGGFLAYGAGERAARRHVLCILFPDRRHRSRPRTRTDGEEFPSLVGFQILGRECLSLLYIKPPPRHTLCAERTRSLATCDILSNRLHPETVRPSASEARFSSPPVTRRLRTVTQLFTFHKGGKIAAFLPMLVHVRVRPPSRYVVAIAIVCLPASLAAAAYLSRAERGLRVRSAHICLARSLFPSNLRNLNLEGKMISLSLSPSRPCLSHSLSPWVKVNRSVFKI